MENFLATLAVIVALNGNHTTGSQGYNTHPQQPPVSRYAPTTTNRQSYECGTYVVTNRQRMGQVLMQRINTCSGAVLSQWWQKK